MRRLWCHMFLQLILESLDAFNNPRLQFALALPVAVAAGVPFKASRAGVCIAWLFIVALLPLYCLAIAAKTIDDGCAAIGAQFSFVQFLLDFCFLIFGGACIIGAGALIFGKSFIVGAFMPFAPFCILCCFILCIGAQLLDAGAQ